MGDKLRFLLQKRTHIYAVTIPVLNFVLWPFIIAVCHVVDSRARGEIVGLLAGESGVFLLHIYSTYWVCL